MFWIQCLCVCLCSAMQKNDENKRMCQPTIELLEKLFFFAPIFLPIVIDCAYLCLYVIIYFGFPSLCSLFVWLLNFCIFRCWETVVVRSFVIDFWLWNVWRCDSFVDPFGNQILLVFFRNTLSLIEFMGTLYYLKIIIECFRLEWLLHATLVHWKISGNKNQFHNCFHLENGILHTETQSEKKRKTRKKHFTQQSIILNHWSSHVWFTSYHTDTHTRVASTDNKKEWNVIISKMDGTH